MLSQVNVLVIFLATLLVLVTIVSCQIVSFITLANLTSATDLGVAAAIGITAAFNVQNVKRGGLNGNQLNLQIIDTNDITNTTVTLFNFPASVFAFISPVLQGEVSVKILQSLMQTPLPSPPIILDPITVNTVYSTSTSSTIISLTPSLSDRTRALFLAAFNSMKQRRFTIISSTGSTDSDYNIIQSVLSKNFGVSIINGVNGGTAVFVVGDERDSIIKAIIDLDTGSSNPLIYLIPGLAKAYDINISLSSSKSDLGSRIFCVDTLPQVSSTSSPSLLLEKEFYQDLKSINSSFYSSSNLQITLRAYVAARFAIQAYSASSSSSTSLIEIIQSVQEFAIPSKEMAGFIFNPLISSGSNCTCPIMELRVGSIVSNNNLSFYNYQTSGSCDDYSPSSTPTAIFLHFYNLGYRYSLIALGSLGVMITLYCIYWIRKNQAIELIRQSNPILLQTLMVISLIIVQVETMTGNSIDAVSCMLDVWIFYPCFVITIATLNAQSVRILAAFRHETAVSVNGKKIVLIRWAVTNNSVGGSGGGGDDKTAATMAGLDKFWVVSTSVLTSIYVVYLSLWTALAPSSLVYIDALGSGAGYGRVCSLDQGRVYELPLIVSSLLILLFGLFIGCFGRKAWENVNIWKSTFFSIFNYILYFIIVLIVKEYALGGEDAAVETRETANFIIHFFRWYSAVALVAINIYPKYEIFWKRSAQIKKLKETMSSNKVEEGDPLSPQQPRIDPRLLRRPSSFSTSMIDEETLKRLKETVGATSSGGGGSAPLSRKNSKTQRISEINNNTGTGNLAWTVAAASSSSSTSAAAHPPTSASNNSLSVALTGAHITTNRSNPSLSDRSSVGGSSSTSRQNYFQAAGRRPSRRPSVTIPMIKEISNIREILNGDHTNNNINDANNAGSTSSLPPPGPATRTSSKGSMFFFDEKWAMSSGNCIRDNETGDGGGGKQNGGGGEESLASDGFQVQKSIGGTSPGARKRSQSSSAGGCGGAPSLSHSFLSIGASSGFSPRKRSQSHYSASQPAPQVLSTDGENYPPLPIIKPRPVSFFGMEDGLY